MTTAFNPTRLDLARRRRGLTKIALAEAAGISQVSLFTYSARTRAPEPETLNRLADVLHFPPEFFFGPTLEEPPVSGASFRALSRLTARLREQTLAAGALAIALAQWIDERFTLQEPSIPEYPGVDPEEAAMAVRTEWGLGERPVKNMIHRLESYGVRVFSLAEDTVAMDAFSCWIEDTPFIFLNTMKSVERSRMDAAHELGHLVLHRHHHSASGREAEREADQFGASFLMPRGSVLANAPRHGRLQDIVKAKQYWAVSVANLTYRMHKVGMLTDWQYRTLFGEISRHGYRSREPEAIRGETSQVLAKVFASLRDDGITMSHVAKNLRIYPDELNRSVFGLVLTLMVEERRLDSDL
ncbi:MAG: ImmA/IrrE family metallo-endopeptidase [Chloroflexi bacterium]|nr:ImmA/IrrE family metallo-endopeptidase [Chloroflexota bacterium]